MFLDFLRFSCFVISVRVALSAVAVNAKTGVEGGFKSLN
jgi:hypothetical protein